MPQSLAKVYLHWIFSTKNRQPFLKKKSVRDEVHSILGGIAKRLDCSPIIVGGIEDHVHMLTTLSRTLNISEAIKEFKRASNHWIGENRPIANFKWQAGYGVFSVSHSQLEIVKRYIENQEAHHRKQTFQDELRELLRRHEIEFDERYVWD